MSETNTERVIEFQPAWDRTDPDPKKNFGVHGAQINWILKGPLGVIQFIVYTNWQLSHVWDQWDKAENMGMHLAKSLYRPIGADVGYHSPKPMFEGHTARQGCKFLEGDCYYDGSALRADKWLQILIEEGGEAIWRLMEEEYKNLFLLEPR